MSPTAKTLKLEKKKALLEAKTAQVIFMKRKKLWLHMAKKEMGKVKDNYILFLFSIKIIFFSSNIYSYIE